MDIVSTMKRSYPLEVQKVHKKRINEASVVPVDQQIDIQRREKIYFLLLWNDIYVITNVEEIHPIVQFFSEVCIAFFYYYNVLWLFRMIKVSNSVSKSSTKTFCVTLTVLIIKMFDS